MAGVRFRLEDADVDRLFDQLGRAATRPRGAMQEIGRHLVTSTQLNIERETAPDGQPWPKLSPRTANRRIGRGRGASRRGEGNMLRVTARLYSSVSFEATDHSVEWGSNLVYARIHQLGGTITMAERPGKVSIKKIRGKGSRFVRASAKGAEERSFTRRAHELRIPARPYLGVSPSDLAAMSEIVADYLRAETGVPL